MNKDRFMKDFNGEKIFSLEYDKETLRDMIIEKQEEIERLKEIIEDYRNKEIIDFSHTIDESWYKEDYEKLNHIIFEIYRKALDTSITSIELRDYIISNLGSGKND